MPTVHLVRKSSRPLKRAPARPRQTIHRRDLRRAKSARRPTRKARRSRRRKRPKRTTRQNRRCLNPKAPSTLKSNAVSPSQTAPTAPEASPANPTPWAPRELFRVEAFPTIFSSPPTRRKIKPSSKVRDFSFIQLLPTPP